MACLDRYFKEHPSDYVVGCPHDYGYLEKPSECYSMSCFKDCWVREIPNTYEQVRGNNELY